MLQQDYLMRMLLQFFQAIKRSLELRNSQGDPKDAADMLEVAISDAVEMDGEALLSLSPDSIAQIMRVTGTDPAVTQYVAHSMLLESVYLSESGQDELSSLRAAQARAIAAEYGFELPDDPSDFESLEEGLDQLALEDDDLAQLAFENELLN